MTKKAFLLYFALLACSFYPSTSNAGEISVSLGEGTSRWYFPGRGELPSRGLRVGYIHPTEYKWDFAHNTYIKLELEFGAHRWTDSWLDKDKYGVYINPMWRYYVPVFDQEIYFGAGIGLAHTSDDTLLDRKLGSRNLFEDKFEAGIIIAKKHRFSLSVNHYSNAKLADINHGVNFYYINYAYSL